jgi:hypothetical protein
VSFAKAVAAFECQKSGASCICLAGVDVVSLDAMTGIYGFSLSSVVANLAIKLLGRVVLGRVVLGKSGHLLNNWFLVSSF